MLAAGRPLTCRPEREARVRAPACALTRAQMDDQYVLQCSIVQSDDGIKNFSRMLNCLDRFGKDLFLEFNEGEVSGPGGPAALPPHHRVVPPAQVALRTLNQAQSAYIHFTLSAGYFLDFMPQQGRSASIKLHLKNMVSIFRSAHGVETVWLQLAVDTECYLRVQLVCKNGVTKMFDLKFEEVRLGFTRLSTTTTPARLPASAYSSSPPPPPPYPTPFCPSTQVSSMNAVYSKEDCSTRICAQAAADTYAPPPPSGTRGVLQHPKLTRAPRGLQQAGTCAQGPPYCAHWRRMPASCALYAPEAHGG